MNVAELVNHNYARLTANDQYVWQYVSNHRTEVVNMTLAELAKKSNVSKSSILRFTQKISFRGFSEFKYALKNEETTKSLEAAPVKKFGTIINATLDTLMTHDFSGTIRLMVRSRKVFLYGTGNLQRLMAQEMRRLFLADNVTLFVVEGVDEIKALTRTLTSEDLVFLISLHGESDNAISFAQSLRTNGIPFVSITSYIDNEIAKLANESIFVNTGEIEISENHTLEVADGFFLLASILFLRYCEFTNQK
jgi:RpiR family glv operon transcriptional regulator